jgi:hypothetical protein
MAGLSWIAPPAAAVHSRRGAAPRTQALECKAISRAAAPAPHAADVLRALRAACGATALRAQRVDSPSESGAVAALARLML